jgi:N-acyl-L-homoserine lactone synthetase
MDAPGRGSLMDQEQLTGLKPIFLSPDLHDRNSPLARVDALAALAVSWVAPIHFCVAQTEKERQAAYHLRYQAIIERGWLQPADLPEGREHDEYDDQAIHILAWDGDTPVATCRLILPTKRLPLPTEIAFEIRVEPAGEVLDAGRFVVARAYSSQEHLLLACLLARTWLEVRSFGFTHCCAAFASRGMLRVFSRMGFRYKVLAPSRYYWGCDRYPVQFDVADSAVSLVENWNPEPPGR